MIKYLGFRRGRVFGRGQVSASQQATTSPLRRAPPTGWCLAPLYLLCRYRALRRIFSSSVIRENLHGAKKRVTSASRCVGTEKNIVTAVC